MSEELRRYRAMIAKGMHGAILESVRYTAALVEMANIMVDKAESDEKLDLIGRLEGLGRLASDESLAPYMPPDPQPLQAEPGGVNGARPPGHSAPYHGPVRAAEPMRDILDRASDNRHPVYRQPPPPMPPARRS